MTDEKKPYRTEMGELGLDEKDEKWALEVDKRNRDIHDRCAAELGEVVARHASETANMCLYLMMLSQTMPERLFTPFSEKYARSMGLLQALFNQYARVNIVRYVAYQEEFVAARCRMVETKEDKKEEPTDENSERGPEYRKDLH